MKRPAYLIIPDIARIHESAQLSREYGAAFEYNDFYFPSVYNDKKELEHCIETYCSLDRDRSADMLHGVFLDIAIASMDPNIREYSCRMVAQSMEIAARLGVFGVIFHTGMISQLNYGIYQDAYLTAAEDTFRPLCAAYPHINIFVENTFEQTPELFLRLMDRMRDVKNFAFCLDYGHAALTATPPERWIEQLASDIGHIHLNDNDLVHDLHLVPGDGKIDFLKFKHALSHHKIEIPPLLEISGIENQKRALAYMNRLSTNTEQAYAMK